MRVALRMTQQHQSELHAHLHPGDGREAAAWMLCGRRRDSERAILCAYRVFPIPSEEAERARDSVTWRTESLAPVLEAAVGLDSPAILHVHSHPLGATAFSVLDDVADNTLHADLAKIYEDNEPTASVVMLPSGEMFGRWFQGRQDAPLDSILVVGGHIQRFGPEVVNVPRAFDASHRQAFGDGTTSTLSQLRIAVVGCSGTGSVVVELLSRLGVGELILIDPDFVEARNLNRIVNARHEDAIARRPKVAALADVVRLNLGPWAPCIIALHGTLAEHWMMAATADVLFGCTDSAEGRLHLDLLCHHYCQPYIDVGVDIVSDGRGGIRYAGAAVHFLRPGGDSLLARKGYRMETASAEALMRTNPAEYANQVERGYIQGVAADRPAVISLNMQAASMAVNELLARLHAYRGGEPTDHMARMHNFIEEFQFSNAGEAPCPTMSGHCGRGDRTLPLGLTGLKR